MRLIPPPVRLAHPAGTGALALVAGALVACAPSDDAPAPATAPRLELGRTVHLGAAGDQHHATVALGPHGARLVAEDRGGLALSDLDGPLRHVAAATGWPQIVADDDGWAVVSAGDGHLRLDAVAPDGTLGEPVFHPTALPPFYPDLAPTNGGWLAVWSELDHLRLAPLDADLRPGPEVTLHLVDGYRTGPMTLRAGPSGLRLAWSELADDHMTVFVAEVGPDGAVGAPLEVDRVDDSYGGRPSLALHPDGRFAVAWRAWHETDDATAWAAVYDADGYRLAGPIQLGGIARRPMLAAAGDRLVAAWADDDGEAQRIVVQLFDWDLAPHGDRLVAGDGAAADRPYLDLVDGAGFVSWETRGDDLDVQVRAVTLRED